MAAAAGWRASTRRTLGLGCAQRASAWTLTSSAHELVYCLYRSHRVQAGFECQALEFGFRGARATGGSPRVARRMEILTKFHRCLPCAQADINREAGEMEAQLRVARVRAWRLTKRSPARMRTPTKFHHCCLHVQADINREADEMEAQLRAARERLEADQAEFRAWERQTARERSAGHFFQSLYQADTPAPPAAGAPGNEARYRLHCSQKAVQTSCRAQAPAAAEGSRLAHAVWAR